MASKFAQAGSTFWQILQNPKKIDRIFYKNAKFCTISGHPVRRIDPQRSVPDLYPICPAPLQVSKWVSAPYVDLILRLSRKCAEHDLINLKERGYHRAMVQQYHLPTYSLIVGNVWLDTLIEM